LDNDTFNIIDIAKGLVPKELSNLVKQLGLNSYLTSCIILNVLHNLQLNFKQYWVDRCKVLIEKELSLNINKKLKRKRFNGRSNSNNLVFPVINYNSSNVRVTNKCESYLIWCAYSCNYGNRWQDF